jgi:hypothetical protein
MSVECPICFDNIEGTVNTITTECGHHFHANCIMKNIAHNGFSCPCCRTKMAEHPQEEDESDMDSDEDNDDYEEEELDFGDNEYLLRGFRLFMNRIEDEENDEEDIEEESMLPFDRIPTSQYITEKLIEQGVTIYQLVDTLLYDNQEYENLENIQKTYDDLSIKVRTLIDDFVTSKIREPNEEPVEETE